MAGTRPRGCSVIVKVLGPIPDPEKFRIGLEDSGLDVAKLGVDVHGVCAWVDWKKIKVIPNKIKTWHAKS